MKYIFQDTDLTGECEYDITADGYFDLLSICFRYCSSISFRVAKSIASDPLLKKLAPFRIPIERYVFDAYSHYDHLNDCVYEIHHYRLCPESREIISCVAQSIFSWIFGWGYKNPEDPVFYRKDGSSLFSSVIHEGICALSTREDEDVSNIVSQPNWICVDVF